MKSVNKGVGLICWAQWAVACGVYISHYCSKSENSSRKKKKKSRNISLSSSSSDSFPLSQVSRSSSTTATCARRRRGRNSLVDDGAEDVVEVFRPGLVSQLQHFPHAEDALHALQALRLAGREVGRQPALLRRASTPEKLACGAPRIPRRRLLRRPAAGGSRRVGHCVEVDQDLWYGNGEARAASACSLRRHESERIYTAAELELSPSPAYVALAAWLACSI